MDEVLDELIQKRDDLQVKDSDRDQIKKLKVNNQKKFRVDKLNVISKYSYTDYFHYLPKTKVFTGGLINFRMVENFSTD